MKKIWIIGIGMGNPGTMTMHACELIKKCGAVAGAERMLDSILTDGKKTFCSIAPFPLLSWMQQQEEEEIAVLKMCIRDRCWMWDAVPGFWQLEQRF